MDGRKCKAGGVKNERVGALGAGWAGLADGRYRQGRATRVPPLPPST